MLQPSCQPRFFGFCLPFCPISGAKLSDFVPFCLLLLQIDENDTKKSYLNISKIESFFGKNQSDIWSVLQKPVLLRR